MTNIIVLVVWTWARLSAVGGAVVPIVEAALAADRPRLGENTRGLRGRFPGVGSAAPRLLVAAVRNSPNVKDGGCCGCASCVRARCRRRRMTTGGDLNLLGVVVAASVVSRGPVASCWAGGPWACASGACVSSTCETRSSWAVSGEASSALGLVGVSSRPRSVDRSTLASTPAPEADGGDAQELPDNRSSSVTGEGMGTSLPSKEGAVGAVSWFRQTRWASGPGVGAAGLAP
jgi:hypothetical protein